MKKRENFLDATFRGLRRLFSDRNTDRAVGTRRGPMTIGLPLFGGFWLRSPTPTGKPGAVQDGSRTRDAAVIAQRGASENPFH